MIRVLLKADRVLYNSVTEYFHRTGRLTAFIDPDANQRVIHFKQTPHYLADLHVVCHLPYSLIT